MTLEVVQHVSTQDSTAVASLTATIAAAATGNTLLLAATCPTDVSVKHVVLPAGWTERYRAAGSAANFVVATKVATGGETSVAVTYADGTGAVVVDGSALAVVEISGKYAAVAGALDVGGTTHSIPGVTPGPGIEALLIAAVLNHPSYEDSSLPGTYTKLDEQGVSEVSHRLITLSRYAASTVSGAYTGSITYTNGCDTYAAQVLFAAIPDPAAEFEATPIGGDAPLTAAFEDLSSGGTVTAWAWTFGDGGTSTSQDPSHVYAGAGSYTVSLTATIDGSPYVETKVAYIAVTADVGYEAPIPGAALVEIYAAAPGSARWGSATWGNDVWSSARWQDVTPQSVRATVRWGSNRPELGILSQPDAGSWALDMFDPERLLDPANADGPYAADLQPGLPIRITHRNVVVRQGTAEVIGHAYQGDRGLIRVTDVQALLSQSPVPSDTTLPDTLFARARSAIAAAGLAVTVMGDPVGGDPDLAPWVTGIERSVWDWIADAAQSVLWIPFVDRLNRLGFRAWSAPLSRGRQVTSMALVDLQSISSFAGLYSVVQVTDDTTPTPVVVTRELTPPPRYGRRSFVRDEPTPDAADWANAVLEDRALPGLRWVPGAVFPLTANDVAYFAGIEAVEQLTISVDQEEPPVIFGGIVVGGEILITAKRDDAAVWSFRYEVAQSALAPLRADGIDPPAYLLTDAGDQYLFPDA